MVTPDHDQIGSIGKDEKVSAPSYQGAPAAASPQLSLSPIAVSEEKNSELYRQFLDWRDKDQRPQAESRPRRSFKRVANASRMRRANPNNVSGSRSSISSTANETPARINLNDRQSPVPRR
jgi:hypothetical protein